jgi:hypothetical protein
LLWLSILHLFTRQSSLEDSIVYQAPIDVRGELLDNICSSYGA